jgi:hypothetical protein
MPLLDPSLIEARHRPILAEEIEQQKDGRQQRERDGDDPGPWHLGSSQEAADCERPCREDDERRDEPQHAQQQRSREIISTPDANPAADGCLDEVAATRRRQCGRERKAGEEKHHHFEPSTQDKSPDTTRTANPQEPCALQKGLTLGITRRGSPVAVDDKQRVRGRVHAVVRWRASLEELLECFDSQTGIPHDAAHRKRIHRVMARDREDADAVRHNDVLTLTNDPKASFLQGPHRIKVVDAGNLRHG